MKPNILSTLWLTALLSSSGAFTQEKNDFSLWNVSDEVRNIVQKSYCHQVLLESEENLHVSVCQKSALLNEAKVLQDIFWLMEQLPSEYMKDWKIILTQYSSDNGEVYFKQHKYFLEWMVKLSPENREKLFTDTSWEKFNTAFKNFQKQTENISFPFFLQYDNPSIVTDFSQLLEQLAYEQNGIEIRQQDIPSLAVHNQ